MTESAENPTENEALSEVVAPLSDEDEPAELEELEPVDPAELEALERVKPSDAAHVDPEA
jgi:hypothetical protein